MGVVGWLSDSWPVSSRKICFARRSNCLVSSSVDLYPYASNITSVTCQSQGIRRQEEVRRMGTEFAGREGGSTSIVLDVGSYLSAHFVYYFGDFFDCGLGSSGDFGGEGFEIFLHTYGVSTRAEAICRRRGWFFEGFQREIFHRRGKMSPVPGLWSSAKR